MDIYKLERLVSEDHDGLINLILDSLKIYGLEKTIDTIKMSGICVSRFSVNNHKALFDQVLTILRKEHCDELKIKELENEVKVLNDVVSDFYNLKNEINEGVLKDKNQFLPFLIAVESMFGRIYLEYTGLSEEEINVAYPFEMVLALLNQEDKNSILDVDAYLQERALVYDEMAIDIQFVLKDFIRNRLKLLPDEEIKAEQVFASTQHFALLEKWNILEHMIESWMYLRARITANSEKIVYIEIPDFDIYKEFILSNFRNRSFRMGFETILLNRILARKSNSDECYYETKLLPPIRYRSIDEEISSAFCSENFFSKNLSELCFGVPLAEWIRAYTVIKQEALEFINARLGSIGPKYFSDWFIVKTEHEWNALFKASGIQSHNAKIIFGKLLFSSASRDLLDCPFIKLGEKFLVIPDLTLISRTPNYEHNINLKNRSLSYASKRQEESQKR